MTKHKHSMHDMEDHDTREHHQWIETLETWRIEHKQMLAKLTKIQAALMEHDAEVESQLHQIRKHQEFIAYEAKHGAVTKNGEALQAPSNPFGSAEQHLDAHRALRADMLRVRETHQHTQQTLRDTIETMRGIRADSFASDLNDKGKADDEEVIHQAGLESFPASDPPSFNP